MKRIIFLVSSLLIVSCNGVNLVKPKDHHSVAYLSGYALSESILTTAGDISKVTTIWVEFMERNATMTEIIPDQMMDLYNSIEKIVSKTNDPYGIMGPFSTFLEMYSAEFDFFHGELVAVDPVPMEIIKRFEMGFDLCRKILRHKKYQP